MEKAEDLPVPVYRKRSGVDIQWLGSTRQFRIVSDTDDGHHRMSLTMVIDQVTSRIREICAEMPGVPDPICRRAADLLEGLVGKTATPGIMRDLGETWDRFGCTHLKDLFRSACYCVPQGQSVRGREELGALFPGLTEEQLYKIFFLFRPDMQGSCIRYSEGSPFLERVLNTPLPKGAEKLRAAAPQPKPARATE